MIAGIKVRPQKWSRVIDLYDDDIYSAIWGSYDEGDERCLGVRWNGDTNRPCGYPSQGGNPVWYVEKDFLIRPILCALLGELGRVSSRQRRQDYKKNILTALSECP